MTDNPFSPDEESKVNQMTEGNEADVPPGADFDLATTKREFVGGGGALPTEAQPKAEVYPPPMTYKWKSIEDYDPDTIKNLQETAGSDYSPVDVIQIEGRDEEAEIVNLAAEAALDSLMLSGGYPMARTRVDNGFVLDPILRTVPVEIPTETGNKPGEMITIHKGFKMDMYGQARGMLLEQTNTRLARTGRAEIPLPPTPTRSSIV